MASLANAEIPAGFTTLEQLIVYVGITAATIYPDNTYLLTATSSEKLADTAVVRTTPTSPLWTYADENGNIAIPARFKA
jgi:hypothetical protein